MPQAVGDVCELLFEVRGEGVCAESFGVAVPQFDSTVWEYFDQAV